MLAVAVIATVAYSPPLRLAAPVPGSSDPLIAVEANERLPVTCTAEKPPMLAVRLKGTLESLMLAAGMVMAPPRSICPVRDQPLVGSGKLVIEVEIVPRVTLNVKIPGLATRWVTHVRVSR